MSDTSNKQNGPPTMEARALIRYSNNGEGPCQWSLATDHTLADVLRPGFLPDKGGAHGLARNDIIFVLCEKGAASVTHAVAAVVNARPGSAVELALLGDAHQVEIGDRRWYEILQVPASADSGAINVSFQALSKTKHPDAGGSKSEMQLLVKARDEGLSAYAARMEAM